MIGERGAFRRCRHRVWSTCFSAHCEAFWDMLGGVALSVTRSVRVLTAVRTVRLLSGSRRLNPWLRALLLSWPEPPRIKRRVPVHWPVCRGWHDVGGLLLLPRHHVGITRSPHLSIDMSVSSLWCTLLFSGSACVASRSQFRLAAELEQVQ